MNGNLKLSLYAIKVNIQLNFIKVFRKILLQNTCWFVRIFRCMFSVKSVLCFSMRSLNALLILEEKL
ncbi:MAG: hypothetical protein AYP45_02485 [Candidatus Brocadia carolinensis]|uniref:Uncharacterized protein n=1 Tax=Candidatus Brocadia carolinensis TaxID=1004156 RepID=A0A1V4AWX9_9BACT|nr:MAG: hypothetical protein AYP45_02485 [Candidatus Brocadia caroliniensis]